MKAVRTIRILQWRIGGALTGAGMTGVVICSWLWTKDGEYSVLGTLMILFLIAAAAGIPLLGRALHQVACREILKRNSLRVHIPAEMVSRNRRGYWRIWVRCVSPVTFEEIWVSSPLLLDDPNPFLRDGVEVMLDPKYGGMTYMLVENLAEK